MSTDSVVLVNLDCSPVGFLKFLSLFLTFTLQTSSETFRSHIRILRPSGTYISPFRTLPGLEREWKAIRTPRCVRLSFPTLCWHSMDTSWLQYRLNVCVWESFSVLWITKFRNFFRGKFVIDWWFDCSVLFLVSEISLSDPCSDFFFCRCVPRWCFGPFLSNMINFTDESHCCFNIL